MPRLCRLLHRLRRTGSRASAQTTSWLIVRRGRGGGPMLATRIGGVVASGRCVYSSAGWLGMAGNVVPVSGQVTSDS